MNRVVVQRLKLIIADSLMWGLSWIAVALVRYDADIPSLFYPGIGIYLATALIVSAIFGWLLRIYRSGFRLGSWEEMGAIAIQVAATTVVATLVSILVSGYGSTPLMMYVLIPPLAGMNILVVRAIYRAAYQAYLPSIDDAKRAIVYGAGPAGQQLIYTTRRDQNSPYKIVGLIDDDPAKEHLTIGNVRVLGNGHQLVEVAKRIGADTVIIAVADMDNDKALQLFDQCYEAGLDVFRMPRLSSMMDKSAILSSIHRLDVSELLGRKEIASDLSSKSGYIMGKRVLVTGGGGSIGSEIARQVYSLGPEELILLDRDEGALHGIQLDIYNKALLDTRDMVLCDIRDKEALRKIFEEHRPQVIFHTAALKHLPMLESYPEEGWKTNTLGSLNLLELAAEYDVEVFVNISTDKAANPTSVLGRTKRLAERLTAQIGANASGKFVSVRFGNVLGSRGSMLATFRHQITAGGPITVTHPDMERYFMTIPEACNLVIQAGAIGRPGEVMILDMGEPVKIIDVANRMIRQSGQPIQVKITGLRKGEKLSEDLIATGEEDVRPFHPEISHVPVEGLPIEQLPDHYQWALEGDTAKPDQD
ncbi:MAG: nucleoside-diphosphate sugar epimerase/dehydratase [Actinomycetaceae bacterium]|nr:nucleoside-diphosphate sugar epimerase/dehydratase [Actinomycetaceae bacterium]